MKRISVVLASLASMLILSSCGNKVQGLWQVERIHSGSTETRPRAQWISFEKKGYQESGHGWQKHNVGTWKYKGGHLTMENANGIKDVYEPWKVDFELSYMELTRREDDKRVKIFLRQIEEIKLTPRDMMLGVWDLKTVLENGKDETRKYNPGWNSYLHVRWDNTFISDNGPNGRRTGVYRISGDRDEMEVFYNDEDCTRETWMFQIIDKRLVLTSVNRKDEIIVECERANRIPAAAFSE